MLIALVIPTCPKPPVAVHPLLDILLSRVYYIARHTCPAHLISLFIMSSKPKQRSYWEQSGGASADTGGRVIAQNPPVPAKSSRSSTPTHRTASPRNTSSTNNGNTNMKGALRPSERIKLWLNTQEQHQWDDLSDLYSLFITTDRLEKLRRRDNITDAEYETECWRLIQKFSGLIHKIPDIDIFYAEYNINAASGKYRLIDAKIPGTLEVFKRPDMEDQNRQNIYCVQKFISLLDNIELNQKSPEDLLNISVSLERSLEKVHGLPKDFPFKAKLRGWIVKMNSMQPTEDLNDADSARFKMDVSAGYNEYLHAKEAL